MDWRLPENRELGFLRYYEFTLKHQSHPGCVYQMLPGIATALDLDEEQRAWLVWLNGNTQNAVTSLLLLEAAPRPQDWQLAVDFWNTNFKKLEWDTDRRHQKSKFGEATELWFMEYGYKPADQWRGVGEWGWESTWGYAFNQPYMGRLSTWSMIEYARILLPGIPDSDTWLLEDKSGSKSHRNGIATVMGYDAVYWDESTPDMLGIVPQLEAYADQLLSCSSHPDAGRLTMESALCTYKGHYKPNRRYANVYNDMFYGRIKKAEARFGRKLDLLWDIRRDSLPAYLRLEDCPNDPGLTGVKQNHFLETGQHVMLDRDYPDMVNDFNEAVALGAYGVRKDPKWN